ncbi:MAG: DUF4347 domain-containing protein [Rhodoferax sp.]|jgi:hypothetical protein|nr:DUF4347 domain-containing protein [Rhodoferax sp.]
MPTPKPKNIAFVDTSVSDFLTLIAGLDSSTEVVLLSGGDGLHQMVEALAGRRDLDAIYVISHGSEGALQLGSLRLDSANLSQHSADLARLGAALTAQGDLLLYGCDVAKGTAGQAFIDQLAHATGADVAASNDLTGSAARGGNWVLESSTGSIDTRFPLALDAVNHYGNLLVTNTIDFETGGGNGLPSRTVSTANFGDVIFKPTDSGLDTAFGDLVASSSLYNNYGGFMLYVIATSGEHFLAFATSGGGEFKLQSLEYYDVNSDFYYEYTTSVVFTGYRDGLIDDLS